MIRLRHFNVGVEFCKICLSFKNLKSINLMSKIKSQTSVLLLAKVIFAMLIVVGPALLFSQVAGCKDPTANNYNPAATTNDGSCTYNALSYTPPVKVNPINAILNES